MVTVRIVDIECAVEVAALLVSWLGSPDVEAVGVAFKINVGTLNILLAIADLVEDAKQPIPHGEKLRQ